MGFFSKKFRPPAASKRAHFPNNGNFQIDSKSDEIEVKIAEKSGKSLKKTKIDQISSKFFRK
jgi:hypothetical protein